MDDKIAIAWLDSARENYASMVSVSEKQAAVGVEAFAYAKTAIETLAILKMYCADGRLVFHGSEEEFDDFNALLDGEP